MNKILQVGQLWQGISLGSTDWSQGGVVEILKTDNYVATCRTITKALRGSYGYYLPLALYDYPNWRLVRMCKQCTKVFPLLDDGSESYFLCWQCHLSLADTVIN